MKKLQNNFTTPDQSKRLLELGVPAWTADCYYYEEGNVCSDSTPQVVPFGEIWTDESTETMFSSFIDIPCWSACRLMEICKICEPKKDYEQLCEELEYCQNYCVLIISHIIANLQIIDFSKLENNI